MMRAALVCCMCVWLSIAPAAEASVGGGDGKFEYVLFDSGARWQNGVMEWWYNDTGRPASLTKDEVISALQRAAQKWHNGCGVQLSYKGTTATPTYERDRTNVVGWQSDFVATGETQSYFSAQRISEADIRLNSSPDQINNLTLLEAVATHEFGHALGLDHSNQPDSIMFADPYHASDFQLSLKGDDIKGCIALYGTTGVVASALYVSPPSQLNSGESATVYVTALQPSSQPAASLDTVVSDNTAQLYFSAYYRGIPVGQAMKLDLVAPDGTLYESSAWDNSYLNGSYWFSLYWKGNSGASVLPGTWRILFSAGGQLKAERSFSLVSSYNVTPLPDLAIIGQATSASTYTFEARNLTPDRLVDSYEWSFDGGAVKTGASQSIVLTGGEHSVRLMTRSVSPRYNGQDNGPDFALTQIFTVAGDGSLAAPVFSGQAGGTKQALGLQVNIVLPDTGLKNIYIVARVGAGWFYKSSAGWAQLQNGAALPLLSVTAPAVLALNVLDSVDVSGLPAGTEVYAGYGESLDQVIATGRYGKIFTLE